MGEILLYTGASILLSFFGELQGDSLRLIGCLLLLSGFFVVIAAMVLMKSFQARMGFVVAGVGVEALGVGLLMNGYRSAQKEQR